MDIAPRAAPLPHMPIEIDRLNEAELIDLNHRIVARLKFLAQMKAHASMLNFRIGERVAFDPPNRPTVLGVITKYNRKSVSVLGDDGGLWTVAPTLLHKVMSPKDGQAVDANAAGDSGSPRSLPRG
jgi:hypothetical protein